MKTGMLCLAALALVSVKAEASPITVTSGPAVHVSFADLDLTSPEGRAVFDQRIRLAAKTLCTIDGDQSADVALGRAYCYKAAVADGRQQLENIAQQRLAQRQASNTAAGH